RAKKQHFANGMPPACWHCSPEPEWENLLDTCGAIKERRTAFPLRTKNRQQTKNDCLTGKAPYRFESVFLQRRVHCEPDFRGLDPRHLAMKIARAQQAKSFELRAAMSLARLRRDQHRHSDARD